MGRLERHLDLEVIERMRSGKKGAPQPIKRVKPPRAASTYRGARRQKHKENPNGQ